MVANHRTRASPWGDTPYVKFGMGWFLAVPKLRFQTASAIEAGCVAQPRTRFQAVCTTKARMPQNGAPRPNGTGRLRLRGDDISETRLPNLLESRAPAQ